MINRIHGWLHRPENGWDPVPLEYARQYGAHEWSAGVQESLLDDLERRMGGFEGKEVLDLGGGPGHYSIAFARRGARVTWYDVSKNYRDFAQLKSVETNVALDFEIGYMDYAGQKLRRQFDLVFNRICWYYCMNDASFARVIYGLVKPGGWAFVDTNHSGFGHESAGLSNRARTGLNAVLGIKVGHPYPPSGRVERLMRRFPLAQIMTEHTPRNDRVLFQKLEMAS